jgi:hypothetical protein
MSEPTFCDITKADIEIFLEYIHKRGGIVCNYEYTYDYCKHYNIISPNSITCIMPHITAVTIIYNKSSKYEYPMKSFKKDIENYKKICKLMQVILIDHFY